MEPGDKPTVEQVLDPDNELLGTANEQDQNAGPALEQTEELDLDTALLRCDELEQTILRLRAEMDNLRKRGFREVEKARKFALERFMGDLLDVSDSLERAIEVSDTEQATIEGLREGSELTIRQLKNVLGKHGLVEIDPKGESFNPEHHEAISMAPVQGVAPGIIIEVVQKGYLLNERLLRPARVVVSQ